MLLLYKGGTKSLNRDCTKAKATSWPSIVKRHNSRPGKCRYNSFCVFLIIMSFVSFIRDTYP